MNHLICRRSTRVDDNDHYDLAVERSGYCHYLVIGNFFFQNDVLLTIHIRVSANLIKELFRMQVFHCVNEIESGTTVQGKVARWRTDLGEEC